ncbi:MAG: hypothetical protein ABL949_05860 [Fimbriimonadaceae bacterium]
MTSEPQVEVAKPTPAPVWWKNTYFVLGAMLLIVGIVGVIAGPKIIRDPGQKREDDLVTLLYFAGAAIMIINGMLSHRQTVREYEEEKNG